MKYALFYLAGCYVTLLVAILVLAYLYDDMDIRVDEMSWSNAKIKARLQLLEHE